MFNFTGDLGKGGKGFNVGKAGGKGSIPEATPIKPLVTEVELKLELGSFLLSAKLFYLFQFLSLFFNAFSVFDFC